MTVPLGCQVTITIGAGGAGAPRDGGSTNAGAGGNGAGGFVRLSWDAGTFTATQEYDASTTMTVTPPPPPPISCSSCSAGLSCNICLQRVTASECPSYANIQNCAHSSTTVGALCEADGECGTSNINNCNPGGWDIYRREVACVDTTGLVCGDTNSDGQVTLSDVTVVQRYVVGLAAMPTGAAWLVADANGDSIINEADYTAILQAVVGLSTPCCWACTLG